jgi:hypothetical protein
VSVGGGLENTLFSVLIPIVGSFCGGVRTMMRTANVAKLGQAESRSKGGVGQ